LEKLIATTKVVAFILTLKPSIAANAVICHLDMM